MLQRRRARVLFSYGTPVAVRLPGGVCGEITGDGGWTPRGAEYVKTDRYFSRTTSRHISQWLNGETARAIPHDEIVKLAAKGA